jgi:hypothetical protein
MTEKIKINLNYKKARTADRRLAKMVVQCFAGTFVVNPCLVLRINPAEKRDGENRNLR